MSSPDLRATVVVATHNRARRLAMLLDALASQSLPSGSYEVIVVDDASSDDTPSVLERTTLRPGTTLRVIRRETSAGPATARNQGWRLARANLVVFTDDDCVPVPAWLETLVALHAASPDAVIQGRTGPLPSELHLMGPLSRTVQIDRLGPFYQTCNMAYPREVLESLGGFDEGFSGPAGEDTDLAWRAFERGATAVFAANALVHHAVTPQNLVSHLRGASRWTESVRLFKRHPELRRLHLHRWLFWTGAHYLFFRALVALILRRRLPLPLVNWLGAPYVGLLVQRAKRRGGPLLVPYWVLYDMVEIAAMLRASARYRTLVI